MADLSGMYSQLGENVRNIDPFNAFLKGQMASQELKNQNFNYQKAQEEYEAQKGLRALFAQNSDPSLSEIGALSPEFAREYAKNKFAMSKDLLEMEKTKGEIQQGQQKISEADIESAARASFPALEMYDRNLASGMPEQQALNIFHSMNGDAVSKAQQAGASWVQGSYDPKKATPDAARALNARYGMFTTRDKAAQAGAEAYSGQAGRAMVPGMQTTPEGYSIQTPGVDLGVTPFNPNAGQQPLFRNPPTGTGLAAPGVMPQQPQAMPTESNIPAQDIDAFRDYYQKLPPGREKDAAREALAKAVRESVPNGGVHADQGQTVTPQELATIRQDELRKKIELETEASGERKVAELEATRKDANKQAINGYFRLRPPQQISNLIRESIQGGGANKINELANLIGVSIPGATPTSALSVIAQQMVASKPFPPGSQSEKELEARMKSIGDPSSSVPAEQRLAQFDEWLRDQEALIAQEAELTPEELIDKVSQGYISKETAAKVYKRMHRGK